MVWFHPTVGMHELEQAGQMSCMRIGKDCRLAVCVVEQSTTTRTSKGE
jgi:hypothetical protein